MLEKGRQVGLGVMRKCKPFLPGGRKLLSRKTLLNGLPDTQFVVMRLVKKLLAERFE